MDITKKSLDALIKEYLYEYKTAQYKELLSFFKEDFTEGQLAGKLNQMTKNGELVRIKRGVYALSSDSNDLYNTLKEDLIQLLQKYENIPLGHLDNEEGKKFLLLYEKIRNEVRS